MATRCRWLRKRVSLKRGVLIARVWVCLDSVMKRSMTAGYPKVRDVKGNAVPTGKNKPVLFSKCYLIKWQNVKEVICNHYKILLNTKKNIAQPDSSTYYGIWHCYYRTFILLEKVWNFTNTVVTCVYQQYYLEGIDIANNLKNID